MESVRLCDAASRAYSNLATVRLGVVRPWLGRDPGERTLGLPISRNSCRRILFFSFLFLFLFLASRTTFARVSPSATIIAIKASRRIILRAPSAEAYVDLAILQKIFRVG